MAKNEAQRREKAATAKFIATPKEQRALARVKAARKSMAKLTLGGRKLALPKAKKPKNSGGGGDH